MPNSDEEKEKLHSVLVSIEETLQKQNSMRRAFVYGLVRGLGTAIGATVLFALFTSLAIQFIGPFEVRTLIGHMLGG